MHGLSFIELLRGRQFFYALLFCFGVWQDKLNRLILHRGFYPAFGSPQIHFLTGVNDLQNF